MKKLQVGIVMMLLFLCGYAQDLPKIVPPSPTSYELGKFGNVNIGYFTGTIQPNIPLMSFGTKNVSVPLSLNYASNGLKVDQLTSNVGLGWNLNVGGVISRVVKGQPDELRTYAIPDNVINNSLGIDALHYYYSLVKDGEQHDSEIDVFNFNFQGRSGKFVLDENKKPIQLSNSGLKIDFVNNFSEFKITDENGLEYFFTDVETSRFRSHGNGHSTWSNINKTSWYLTKIKHQLGDEIYFKYQNNNYTYDVGNIQDYTITFFQGNCGVLFGNSDEVSLPLTNVGEYNVPKLVEINSNNPSFGKVTLSYIQEYHTQSKYLISNIRHTDIANNSIQNVDLNFLFTSNNRTFLEEVTIKQGNKNYQLEYVEPHSFPERLSYSQDYWGYFNNETNTHFFPNPTKIPNSQYATLLKNFDKGANKEPNDNYAQYGMLKKIIYPTKGTTEFEFEGNSYYGEETTESVIATLRFNAISNQNDVNGASDSKTIEVLQDQKITFNDKGVAYNVDSCEVGGEIFQRTKGYISVLNLTTNSLEYFYHDVNIPQPRSLSLLYSPSKPMQDRYVNLKANNTYQITLSVQDNCLKAGLALEYFVGESSVNQTNILSGGLRVKRIINTPFAQKEELKRFYYGDKLNLNISSGIRNNSLKYVTKNTRRNHCPGDGDNDIPNDYFDSSHYIVSGTSIGNMFYSQDISSTPYKNVTVSYGGDNFENGGDEFEYITPNPEYSQIIYGKGINGSITNNTNWNSGFLKKQVTFKKNNDTFTDLLIKENFYKKDVRYTDLVYGFTIRKKFDLITYYTSPNILNIENLDIMKNKLTSSWHYLEKTVERSYDSNGENPITNATDYFYDNLNHLQQTRVETKNSKGELLKTKTYYAADVNNTRLLDEHRIAEPLKVENYKSNVLLSTLETAYASNHNPEGFYLPKYIKTSKGSSGNNTTEERVVYHTYDNKGNPVEVSKKDGTKIYYVWGYRQTQPIAKIEGYSSISPTRQAAITGTVIISNTDKDRTIDIINPDGSVTKVGAEGNLREALRNLRNLFSEAQVTTYTYDPLIGVTSITDPRGQTMYYDYDDFSRLRFIKDEDRNIVKENQYNYKN